MKRLALFAVLVACSSVCAGAQETARLPLIGWLRIASPESPPGKPLIDALAERGLVQGQNIRLEIRSAAGRKERFAELAEKLVQDDAKVIIAFGPDATRAALAATRTIPIVAAASFIEEGLADVLSRPVGNLTGVSILVSEIDPKKLEVLKELLPSTRHVGVLNDSRTRVQERPAAMAAAAQQLGLDLSTANIEALDELEPALQRLKAAGATAIAVNASSTFATMRHAVGEAVMRHRLPAICQWREMVEAGCLASYGLTLKEMFGLVADQTAQIHRGAKPDTLPIAQPRRFELAVSLKVARELGLTIPRVMIERADEVIE